MKLSKTMSSLSISPTVALNSKAKKMRSDGVDVLNFAVGEPDFPTPEPIVKVGIEALQAGKTRYGAAGGGLVFREALAAKLQRENNLTYDPSEIVVGIGAKEILFHTFLAMLNPGDEVLLSAPCWVSYKEQILAAGATPVVIPLPPEPGAAIVTAERIEKYASERTVAFVLCSPNNPAGYVLPEGDLRKLGAYLAQKDWWVISDEIYEYLTFSGEHHSLAALCPELKERYVHINGLSKGFAMTGWRVGYAAGPKKLISLVRSLQSHSSTCLPPFIEEAATYAVQQGKPLMAKEMQTLAQRCKTAETGLAAIKGIHWIAPHGAFYVFVDVRQALKESSRYGSPNTLAFCEELLTKHHIAVVPGEAFEAPGFIRFSYACDQKTFAEGLQRFKTAVEAL